MYDSVLYDILFNAFENLCKTSLKKYKVELTKEDIKKSWDEFIDEDKANAENDDEEERRERSENEDERRVEELEEESEERSTKCQHVFTKSKVKRGQTCNEIVCKNSKTGKYCRLHMKSEEVEMLNKREGNMKEVITSGDERSEGRSDGRSDERSETKGTFKKVIRKTKYGNFIDDITKFIFDTSTYNIIGKEGTNGKILGLTREDVSIVKKRRYKLSANCKYDIEEIEV